MLEVCNTLQSICVSIFLEIDHRDVREFYSFTVCGWFEVVQLEAIFYTLNTFTKWILVMLDIPADLTISITTHGDTVGQNYRIALACSPFVFQVTLK